MGLLDDAIREHLELKRLRGADPGDVAREEDALGPVHRRVSRSLTIQVKTTRRRLAPTNRSRKLLARVPRATRRRVRRRSRSTWRPSSPDLIPCMARRAAPCTQRRLPIPLMSKPQAASRSNGRCPAIAGPTQHRPRRRAQGRGRSGSNPEQGVDAPVEDVLEETPDFLRDTPEQERLWFEQRPPRDFDFNE